MKSFALIWNEQKQWYDIFTMADSKTQNDKLGCINADDIRLTSDINDRIAHEWGKEHES